MWSRDERLHGAGLGILHGGRDEERVVIPAVTDYAPHVFPLGPKADALRCLCGAVTWREALDAWKAAGSPTFVGSAVSCRRQGTGT